MLCVVLLLMLIDCERLAFARRSSCVSPADAVQWLQTPYDCGYVIVRDPKAHRRAMTIAASYLPTVADGERDPAHYVPELSRRARGFATFAMLRHLGRQGVAAMVERHCQLARLMVDELTGEAGLAVLNEVILNQAILRFGVDQTPEVGVALATIAALQQEGTCFAGAAQWQGRWVMRLSVIDRQRHDRDRRTALRPGHRCRVAQRQIMSRCV